MNRRRFIETAAVAGLVRPAAAAVSVEILQPRNSYQALLADIEPGPDNFPFEKEAAEIAAHLKRLISTRTLPYAPGLRGISPLPLRYLPLAQGVATAEYETAFADIAGGMKNWLDSLGEIRAARFYVLPDNLVRFEVAGTNQYRVGKWNQQWAGGLLTGFAPVEETVVSEPAQLFRDITSYAFQHADSFERQLRAGIPWWRSRLDAATGIDVHGHNGIAVGDIDNDGLDEIYVCQPGGLSNRLYKIGPDAVLEDITDRAGVGVLDPTSSALFLDLRNIGLRDLVVLRPDGPILFLNQGGGRFSHKPGAFRFRTAPQGSFTGMAAADYDRDGRVDLYVCTYSFFRDGNQYRYPVPYHDAQNGPPNFLFRNELAADGTGQLTDVTEAAGLNHNNNRFSFAPAWCDYNGDGWPDLYVANDFGRKNLYRNEGGKFRDVAAEAGVEDIGDGMSAAWFDYNGDGRPDLYVSNMWSDAGQRIVSQKNLQPAAAWKRHAKGNSLFRNRGDGTFEDTGAAEGVEMGRWAWASDGIDFDNDGVPEIFVTAGMLTNSSDTDLESFFWRKVAAASPPSARSDSAYENGWNALSQAVHDKYSEAGRQANVFYVRRGDRYYDFSGVSGLDFAGDSRAFAATDLDGDGNLDLLVKSRLGPQVRVFQNACGKRRKCIAFDLRGVQSNRDAIGARIEVDGKVKFIAAGSGYLSQHTRIVQFGLGERDTAELIKIDWPSGLHQQLTRLRAGFRYTVQEGLSETRGVAFAARAELPAGLPVGENESHFTDTWFIKPVPLPEQSAGPGFLKLSSLTPERQALYSVFCRYLFDVRAEIALPIWFLVDEQSRVHKIYFQSPDQGDLDRLRDPARLALALPSSGRYYTEPSRNYTALGAALFAAGFSEQALRYLEQAPQESDSVLFAIGKIHLQAARVDRARGYFAKGLTISPASADGWNSLGAVEVEAGNLREALLHFNKALALQPQMTSALINAGQAQAALGQVAEAEKLFRKALESRPDSVPAINRLAALRNETGHTEDAIAALRYGIQAVPDEDSFYLNLAAIYVGQENFGAARLTVEKLLQRKPASAAGKEALRQLESR